MVASTPLSRARLTAVLNGLLELGAETVAYRPRGGAITFSVGAPIGEQTAAFEQPVVVSGEPVGDLLAWGLSGPVALEAAVAVCSRQLAELWVSAREEESLAAEVIHAYDELHVLYGLGDALAGKLSVLDAAYLILDRGRRPFRRTLAT